MSNKILFYSDRISNRLKYVVQLVFTETVGWDVFFTQDEKTYVDSILPKIEYSQKNVSETGYFIASKNSLLFENALVQHDFVEEFKNLDVLSQIFVMVSRYEEYMADPSVLDAHQRFPASQSVASQLKFLRQPIVNQAIIHLKNALIEHYPNLKLHLKIHNYNLQLTYDIDQAWAFKNKGFIRGLGGFIMDLVHLKFKTAFSRLGVMLGLKKDPEYTFDYIEKQHKKLSNKISTPIFFWLLGNHGEFDKNIDWKNKSLQRLIKRLSKRYTMGIHPSYASNSDIYALKNEILRLDAIIQMPHRPTINSRQHYLKLQFPNTYRRLIETGMQNDYTMGYADDIGFRAGIATPFYWYDLEKEQVTHLKIHPFQVMEVTLKEYLKLSPQEVLEHVKPLIDATKAVDGTFTTLWHNSTLSNKTYSEWREVYEKIIDEAS